MRAPQCWIEAYETKILPRDIAAIHNLHSLSLNLTKIEARDPRAGYP
jgi:hypothetical protein